MNGRIAVSYTHLDVYKRQHGMYLNADAMEVCLDDCVSRGMEMYLSLPHIMSCLLYTS